MDSTLKKSLLNDDDDRVEDNDRFLTGRTNPIINSLQQVDPSIQYTSVDQSYPEVSNENGVDADDSRSQHPVTLTSSVALRARWVSALSLLFYAMATYPDQAVMSQYLTHRWSHEANVSQGSSENLCFRNHSDPRRQEEDEIQARVSTAMMYYGYTVSLPGAVSSIIMGTYSDVIGRRKVLLSPLAATVAKYIGYVIIIRYDLNTDFFYVMSIVEGLGGSFFVVLIASFSITADLSTSKSNCVLWMNILCFSQCTTGAFTIATGYVIDNFGFEVSSIMVLVPISISFLLALFLLPETRPRAKERTLNFLANMQRIVKLYTSEGSRRGRTALVICLFLFFFCAISNLNVGGIDALYQLRQPLCWDATQIGLYSATSQAGMAIVGLIFLSIVQQCGCLAEEKLAMIGVLCQGGSYILEAFVKNTWMMYLVPVISFPAFTTVGTIRGIMSLLAGPYNQGAVFASIAVVEVACNIASNAALFQAYAATVGFMAGAVYLLMAAFCFIDFFLFFVFFHFYDDPSKKGNIAVRVSDNNDTHGHDQK